MSNIYQQQDKFTYAAAYCEKLLDELEIKVYTAKYNQLFDMVEKERNRILLKKLKQINNALKSK